MYENGKLFLYTAEFPEIYMYQWDGADFQYEKTIKPNFPKFVRYPENAEGDIDFRAVSAGGIISLDLEGNELYIAYKEGIEEGRYSVMSEEEQQMSQISEPMYKIVGINLDDLSERYQDAPQEILPLYFRAGEGRWIGLKNIYLKMEEEDYPTLYFMERR